MKQSKIIISEGNRPLWQRIVAALLFTGALLLLLGFFLRLGYILENGKLKGGLGLLEIAAILVANGLLFSVVKDLLFDLEKKKYKIQYCVGPFKFGKWKELPKIQYVSVFRQLLKNGDIIYETNLWYNQNRHFKVYENTNKQMAFIMGKTIARSLDVKLLDATIPNEFKWKTFDSPIPG